MAGEIYIADKETLDSVNTLLLTVKENLDIVDTIVDTLTTNLATTKTDVASNKTSLAAMTTNLATVKTDVAANKTSLSMVTTNLATLLSNVAVIDNVVDSILEKSLNVNQLGIRGYSAALNVTTLTDIINISGSGFLSTALVCGNYTGTSYSYAGLPTLIITIDGTQVFNLTCTGKLYGNNSIGILNIEDLIGGSSFLGNTININSIDNSKSYQLSAGSITLPDLSGGGCLFALNGLIRFNSSLKIQGNLASSSNYEKVAVKYYLD